MSKKKKILAGAVIVFVLLLNLLIILNPIKADDSAVSLDITVKAQDAAEFQIFWLTEDQNMPKDFNENQSQKVYDGATDAEYTLSYTIPTDAAYLRMDFGETSTNVDIIKFQIRDKFGKVKADSDMLLDTAKEHSVKLEKTDENGISVKAGAKDPHAVWDVRGWEIPQMVHQTNQIRFYGFKVILLLVLDLGLLIVLKNFNRMVSLPKELIQNRKLILKLAKNDFKTKFAGSFFGTFWAFVQPIITVLVYWFVFEKGLKAGGQLTAAGIEVPFVLWLIAGLVPWFFFSDALGAGTNAMMEYSYLVKKVVFKISILPIVKVISALFVHLFFIAFTVVLYAAYRYYPDLYTLQLVYYSCALLIFTLALVYATCAIVVFFKDLTQIINIVLQVGVWITPIMWNIDTMQLSPVLIAIFKLNPLYYIVAGYRDALINKVWFFEHPGLTLYFWVITLLLLALGTSIFKRLRVHFADVL